MITDLSHVSIPAGRVFHTDDCRHEVNRLKERGVQILKEPDGLPFGVRPLFADPYGNAFAPVQTR
jgi:predicted enzyme related to lactoylglutathione lyase